MVKINSYEGLTAVITGAGSGIGRELAKQLVAAGCSVALGDIRGEILEETKQKCVEIVKNLNQADSKFANVKIVTKVCDIANLQDVENFHAFVVEEFSGKINILINNAGMVTNGSFLEMSSDRFNRTFDVNFRGTVYMTRAFLPNVISCDVGYIVNVSSINAMWCCLGPAKIPFKAMGHAPYCAAKAAVKGFTEALLHDSYQNFPHIGVVCVHPGVVATNVFVHADTNEDVNAKNVENLIGYLTASAHGRGKIIDQLESLTGNELHRQFAEDYRNGVGTTSQQAAKYILSKVMSGSTRVLVGDDAVVVDLLARLFPRLIYNDYFMLAVLLPWMRLCHVCDTYVAPGAGRFSYPLLVSIIMSLGYSAAKSVTSKL